MEIPRRFAGQEINKHTAVRMIEAQQIVGIADQQSHTGIRWVAIMEML